MARRFTKYPSNYVRANTTQKGILEVPELLLNGTMKDFEAHNALVGTGELLNDIVYGEEADLNDFLEMRDHYTFTEDTSGGPWYYIDIARGHHFKYGVNYIYVNPEKKVWRYKQTPTEFYGKHGTPFYQWLGDHDYQY